MEPNAPPPEPVDGEGYSGAPVAGAALATLASPFRSLIAALLLQGRETNPAKRAQLQTWAWVSGGLVAIGAVIGLVLLISAISAVNHVRNQMKPDPSGPCRGGPILGAAGRQVGPNKYAIPCEFGGTAIVHLP
jgi:hypothetical protein